MKWNWEAISGDIAFDKKFKLTICVDVRYVLWCIDVLRGAKNIINELQIKKLPFSSESAFLLVFPLMEKLKERGGSSEKVIFF